MAHATHTMANAMGAHVAESEARAVTNTSCGSHLGSMASAHVRGALAMGSRALAMNRCAFPVCRAEILRMSSRLA